MLWAVSFLEANSIGGWTPCFWNFRPLLMSSRLYDHVSTMWYYEGWLPEASVEYARTHYAAYSVKRPDGLRIISIDTDMCTSFSFSRT